MYTFDIKLVPLKKIEISPFYSQLKTKITNYSIYGHTIFANNLVNLGPIDLPFGTGAYFFMFFTMVKSENC